jgi:hypothetical protein
VAGFGRVEKKLSPGNLPAVYPDRTPPSLIHRAEGDAILEANVADKVLRERHDQLSPGGRQAFAQRLHVDRSRPPATVAGNALKVCDKAKSKYTEAGIDAPRQVQRDVAKGMKRLEPIVDAMKRERLHGHLSR